MREGNHNIEEIPEFLLEIPEMRDEYPEYPFPSEEELMEAEVQFPLPEPFICPECGSVVPCPHCPF